MLGICSSDFSQKPTMYTGGRLHMRPILVKAGEGVVGGGCQGVAGVYGRQHLLGCSCRLPGRVGGHKAQE